MGKKKKEKKKGSSRMRELGYRQVMVWFPPDEMESIARACSFPRGAIATFVRMAAVRMASEFGESEGVK